ncbi:CIA30 family protein [Roseovarius sp. LXJ103]|uniref:CIA30 family protein n=1 Tax=Roseovarius carneus TaxID=2853164 RepID=UPI000D60B42B|nr:CIA30 family protein [Roseovarius carneus]MBZ8118619.1 CIA30 family protein [Roseovarius carneus]PWE37266.1 NADH:ubiquinone oxidoreductase complex i intermediate-associated protein 30 [Pelagicola sp. LXJ1103]
MDLTPDWEYVADRVMGGVSTGGMAVETVKGRSAARLTGQVSLDNNGGFVQMAFDLADGASMDASPYAGIEIETCGNGETYDLRLRTDRLTRPWQSFRAEFLAPPEWQVIRIPFVHFAAHRTEAVFDPAGLRRIGVLAIGRVFEADVAIARIALYP